MRVFNDIHSKNPSQKKAGHPSVTDKQFYEEIEDPAIRVPSRLGEALRMIALGLGVVVILNSVNVYYKGLQLEENVATAAYSGVNSILSSDLSRNNFTLAQTQFQTAKDYLWFLSEDANSGGNGGELSAGVTNVLTAGQEISKAGELFMAFVDEMKTLSGGFLTEKSDSVSPSLTESLKNAYEKNFKSALESALSAQERMAFVDTTLLPSDVSTQVRDSSAKLQELTHVLTQFDTFFPELLNLLGDEHPATYLVLLENNNEARPGGGFIGSYVLLDVNDGYLENMTFNDVYELDGQYYEPIAPPGEIADLTNNWRFRDSNYSPDLTVSSAKSAWFLEEEGGRGVDYVMTVDLTFVSRLLQITGPIKLESLPIALSADNFSTVLSYMVESKLTGIKTPKLVLGEFVEAVQTRCRELQPWEDLLQLSEEMALAKHFSIYSDEPGAQDLFEELGLLGKIDPVVPKEDYTLVVHTSIGGNKTDPYLEQSITHRTQIEQDGLVYDEIEITRTHTWTDTDEMMLRNLLASFGFTDVSPEMIDMLGRGTNRSAMRVYVPHESAIVSAHGIETTAIETHTDLDLGLDYFYFKWDLSPGESETITLTYMLPFTLDFNSLAEYRLHVIKQPGDLNTVFKKEFAAPDLNSYGTFPEVDEISGITYEETLDGSRWATTLLRDFQIAKLLGRGF
ncbi:MAG: DUF4012 domain-containing protein [Candidatus Gracilibacteria bacterium]